MHVRNTDICRFSRSGRLCAKKFTTKLPASGRNSACPARFRQSAPLKKTRKLFTTRSADSNRGNSRGKGIKSSRERGAWSGERQPEMERRATGGRPICLVNKKARMRYPSYGLFL